MTDHVKNMDGISGRKCVCRTRPNTWLSHWERGTRLQLPVKSCRNVVEVGAHVKLVGSEQRIAWIIPFCQWHNKHPSNTLIPLKSDVILCGPAKIDCG